jgi:hypothetical protein
MMADMLAGDKLPLLFDEPSATDPVQNKSSFKIPNLAWHRN